MKKKRSAKTVDLFGGEYDPGRIITKLGFAFDGTRRTTFSHLELTLLADVKGLRELARHFRSLAKYAEQMRPNSQFDYRFTNGFPFDSKLSDDVSIRVELLPPGDARQTLRRRNVSQKSRRRGDMGPHLRALTKEAHATLRGEERRDKAHRKKFGSTARWWAAYRKRLEQQKANPGPSKRKFN